MGTYQVEPWTRHQGGEALHELQNSRRFGARPHALHDDGYCGSARTDAQLFENVF